jgi:hypothetical protein
MRDRKAHWQKVCSGFCKTMREVKNASPNAVRRSQKCDLVAIEKPDHVCYNANMIIKLIKILGLILFVVAAGIAPASAIAAAGAHACCDKMDMPANHDHADHKDCDHKSLCHCGVAYFAPLGPPAFAAAQVIYGASAPFAPSTHSLWSDRLTAPLLRPPL